MGAEKTYSLSIYLHKPNITKCEDCLKQNIHLDDNFTEYTIDRNRIGTEGNIYISKSDPHYPDWKIDINSFTNEEIILSESSTNRAVVILNVGNQFMSITFGHGKHMLDENTIIRDFGIKVAASLISSEQIRSLSILNIEDVILNTQRQSSIYSNKEKLQIDTYKDILKEVAGSPHRRRGGSAPKFLVGTDSLKATKKLDLEKILDDLKYYKNIYNSESYRTNGFEWLDNIQRVKDTQLVDVLDALLVNSISQNLEDLHIAANRPIDWSKLRGFLVTGLGKRKEPKNFSLEINSEEYFRYIKNYTNNVILGKLKRDELYILYDQDDSIEKLSNIYSSIIFETVYRGEKYVLSHGEWLNINNDYYESVKNRVQSIEIEEEIEFIDYDENRKNSFADTEYGEGRYNIDLANSKDDYFLLDQHNFQVPVPGNNPIEPCDVFTRNKELIHVKRYNGSSSLSHLLAQGIVSANQLTNEDFRKHINEHVGEAIIKPTDSISSFKVVFAIIHKDQTKSAHDIFPFFTMVNLVQTTEQLKRMQIGYSIKKINIIPLT